MHCPERSSHILAQLCRTRNAVAALLFVATAILSIQGADAYGAPAHNVLRATENGRSLLNAASPAMTVTLRDDGMLMLSEAPDTAKRPFKVAFYYDFAPADPLGAVEYVRETVMPTIASLLGRWIRVRHPAGPMDLAGKLDLDSEAIPPGPDNGKYDADLVMKVTSGLSGSTECSAADVAIGEAGLFEPLTKRPIFGQIRMCQVDPTGFLPSILQFIVHEFLHILAFEESLIQMWATTQALSLGNVIRTTQADAPPLGGVGPVGIGAYNSLVTPNALREARLHFGCPEMTGLLMEERGTEITEHFSMRHYNGALMRAGSSPVSTHYGREAVTDITLGVLQDTGWYDVKYGSGGFNTYGYQAGCPFVNGTFADALADPIASQYLCSPQESGSASCFSDFSGQGICRAQRRESGRPDYDLFTVDLGDYANTEDCQPAPGTRCIDEYDDAGAQQLLCVSDFSCSATGEVLVEGLPCADFVDGCPPDELMCGDPGLLTCATPELNDCNSRGDCRQGRCFCHLGWGGADCNTPACTSGCPAADIYAAPEPCPPSGFCGVPVCGTWSVGDTGKGIPCTSN